MGFRFVRAFLVILLASHGNCNLSSRRSASSTSQLPPAEQVSRTQLSQYTQPRQDTWEKLARSILEAKGSLIGRTPDGVEKLQKARELRKTPDEARAYIMQKLGWGDTRTGETLNLWDEEVKRESKAYAVLLPNEHPYDLPKDVQHYIYWIRATSVSQDSFPNVEPERAKVLVRYIKNFDFYGSYGFTVDEKNIRRSDFIHPGGHVWRDEETDTTVTREEGIAAFNIAGAKVSERLQEHFHPDEFAVLFNCSPARWVSVPDIEHFHVMVMPRSKLPFIPK